MIQLELSHRKSSVLRRLAITEACCFMVPRLAKPNYLIIYCTKFKHRLSLGSMHDCSMEGKSNETSTFKEKFNKNVYLQVCRECLTT